MRPIISAILSMMSLKNFVEITSLPVVIFSQPFNIDVLNWLLSRLLTCTYIPALLLFLQFYR